jgi:threonine dehydrogenase-like Zn-dependent dehydrogenase
MKALRIDPDGIPQLVEQPSLQADATNAVLQLRVAMLDSSDRSFSPVARIPGDRFVATVVEATNPDLPGARVVASKYIPCGACRPCIDGMPQYCPLSYRPGRNGTDGCIAQRFKWPENQLIVLPQQVRDYDAVLIHEVATALAIHDRLKDTTRVLVTGLGAPAAIIAVALRHRIGPLFFGPETEAHAQAVKRFAIHRDPGGTFPVVVAISPDPSFLAHALRRVAPQGQLLVHWPGTETLTLSSPRIHRADITISGVSGGPLTPALPLLKKKELCEILSKVRAAAIPLEQAPQAWDRICTSDSLAILVDNIKT